MFGIRCAAAAMLLLSPVPALAEDWRIAGLSIGEGNRGVTYVDAGSIREKRGKLRFRSEQHLERARDGYDRISAVSEVDCASMTVTVLREGYYLGRALVAFGPAPREANYYSATTSHHWVLRRVCEGDYLGSAADRSSDSARLFAMDWSPVPGRLSVAMPVVLPGRPSGTQVAAMGAAGPAAVGSPRR